MLKDRAYMKQPHFTGNIFLFHAFDVGDDIALETIQANRVFPTTTSAPSKHFKNYHIPLSIKASGSPFSPACVDIKLHNFGVVTIRHKIPFNLTIDKLPKHVNDVYDLNVDHSIRDANLVFATAKNYINQATFFHLRTSYVLIQVDPFIDFDAVRFKEEFGTIIASTLRFDLESFSEHKKNEILESGIRYYRGDLIIVDTEATFMYDDEYDEALDLFEFANMQQCELNYFDRMLDEQLNVVYSRKVKKLPWKAYIPLIGVVTSDAVSALSRLRVDISVITERLSNSIKLADDLYYSELFSLLAEKLDLRGWKKSIDSKLDIIEDIATIYQDKAEIMREHVLSMAIILLFIIEITFGMLNLFLK